MWVPETVNPPALAAMVAIDVEPSPQSIAAEYSDAVAFVSASVKVATIAVIAWPSVADKVVPPAVIDASEIARSTQRLQPTNVLVVAVMRSQITPASANLSMYGFDPSTITWSKGVPSEVYVMLQRLSVMKTTSEALEAKGPITTLGADAPPQPPGNVAWTWFGPPLSWYPQLRLLHAPKRMLLKLAVEPAGIVKPPPGLPMAREAETGIAVARTPMLAARIADAIRRRTAVTPTPGMLRLITGPGRVSCRCRRRPRPTSPRFRDEK